MLFRKRYSGFTLIELMIAIAILGILVGVALPNYQRYVVRAARIQAQNELLELASLQEKIFLNSNSYAFSVTTAYNGTSAGGLGRSSGTTKDGRYALSIIDASSGVAMTAVAQSYVLVASPVSGGPQVGDGQIRIDHRGVRTCSPACGPNGPTTW